MYGGGYGRPPPPQQGGGQGGYGRPPPPQQQQMGGGYGYGYGQGQTQGQMQVQGGGYRPQQANDQELYSWFRAVDTDQSGAIDAHELQRALINGDWSPFSMETVRLMVGMFDRDMSGTIDFNEFKGLWKYIEEWKKCFRAFDRDNSGTIDKGELDNALRQFGIPVSRQVIDMVVKKVNILDGPKTRYGGLPQQGGGSWGMQGPGGFGMPPPQQPPRDSVSFDRFIYICVTIKTLTDSFKQLDKSNTGKVTLDYNTYLEFTIKNL
ncbi:Sorcin [Zancudomyces culisetae]|uniref:Sorcin n=1 Tax=Zancudomyces culisetae TaxID=1213189 RepID=A0A1R1PKP8_ZANCU|nr:Sorcin [Zancudomyces culisetae]|eukprot:OMH81551.1 Sorcin [Zancudomyces culisetae]